MPQKLWLVVLVKYEWLRVVITSSYVRGLGNARRWVVYLDVILGYTLVSDVVRGYERNAVPSRWAQPYVRDTFVLERF